MVLRVMSPLPDLTLEQRAQARIACGFACVRDGVTIYRYLSLPDGNGVTLLCPTCHGLVEEGRITPAQVQNFHASPVVRQRHFSRDRLPFSTELPRIDIGGVRQLRDAPTPITLDGNAILSFAPPQHILGATHISVWLGDVEGNIVQIIDKNEWKPDDGAWQFQLRGDRYVIAARHGIGLCVLRIVARNHISVEHLRTVIGGRQLEITPDWIEVDGKRHIGRVTNGGSGGLEY